MKKFIHHSGARLSLLLFVLSLIFTSTFFANDLSYLLKTSVVGYPEHAPFDGTTYPVKKVPNWMAISEDKWDYDYNSLSTSDLMDLPKYEPNQLKTSADALEWGNPADDVVRNAKITYPVPYMGNYLLDGREYAGSHLAIDIKIPKNTPIYAIANGTVVKAVNQTNGFGNHIVIQHNNFPSYNDPNVKETLFSSYCHLGSLSVKEGDTVTKGEMIGLSGETGTATTPHLHFQLDNDNAPWHPYWPFTWKEASDAGLDFFSAINAGLGQAKAIETTVNPMKYVQKYMDESNLPAETDTGAGADTESDSNVEAESYVPDDPSEDENVNTDDSDVTEEEVVAETAEADEVASDTENTDVLDPPMLQFDYAVSSVYYDGQGGEFTVLLRDQYDNVFKDGFTGEIVIKSDKGFFTPKPSLIRNIDFGNDGNLIGKFSRLKEGRDRLLIEYNGEKYYSDWFDIKADETNVTFKDLPESNKYYTAVGYLVAEGVVAGYPDGTFRPDKAVSRVEAIKFIYEGLKKDVKKGNLPFSDIDKSQWYSGYLYTAYNNGVVSGYSDGTFKPSNTVNKAEFYKILFNGMGVDVNPTVSKNPYKDVPKDDWYAPYIAYAKDLGIIDSSVRYLKPNEGMTRGEVAYAIYKLMQVMK